MNLKSTRRNLAFAFTLTVLIVSATTVSAKELPDPTKQGPYPVGVTTTVFVDHSREDKLTKGPRTLVTEIWYPAGDEAKDLPKNRFSDFLFRGNVEGLDAMVAQLLNAEELTLDSVDAEFENYSVRDARIRDGKYPLIVFSHGNGGIRAQNAFWCEHMASHGYIVMSPDHTGNCAATVVDGEIITYSVGMMMQAARDRPVDVIFLIDEMTKMAGGTDSRFNGRVDLENIGVAGHSFGGLTSAAVIDQDERVDAIIPMTPVWPTRRNFTTPVLIFVATEDATISMQQNKINRQRYTESKGPAYLLELPNGGHYSFTEMFQMNPEFGDGVGVGKRVTVKGQEITYLDEQTSKELANSYSTAFFGIYLKGQEGYREYLDTNHYGDELIHKFQNTASSN